MSADSDRVSPGGGVILGHSMWQVEEGPAGRGEPVSAQHREILFHSWPAVQGFPEYSETLVDQEVMNSHWGSCWASLRPQVWVLADPPLLGPNLLVDSALWLEEPVHTRHPFCPHDSLPDGH
ncbi:unnamed protein product [Rangifer tarandus platyrhynchus]|uniref:Uncharacterized protein n=2 Tax=Rangifer tarandus platyrhynchus TaxID=3082113 RepID=A0ABN8ZQW6_RANTA|nr:unnamed protein product [Rangifer tarandus platyrhynchus]